MHAPNSDRWTFARRFVAGTGAALAAVVWTHALAGALRLLGAADAPLAAAPLTVAAALVALVAAAALPRHALAVGLLAGAAAAVVVSVLAPGAWAAALALPLAGTAAAALAEWIGRRLPEGVDSPLVGRGALVRWAALGWAVVAVLSVVQTGRLATFVTDTGQDFVVATTHPFWHKHQCLPAYLYGAELAAGGEDNVYDARHYPGLNPDATPETAIAGMVVEDPYQYPPQFLLLPGLALALTDDLTAIRTVWFGLQATLFAGVFAALALWVGGRAGRLALWLLPAVLLTFPVIYTFQYGQFHLAAIALSIAAMLSFAARRRSAGGLLLAVAILAKIFPAVLLVALVARGRFRELAWTAAWGGALTVAAWLAFGPAPFAAFFDYHLPRMGSGAAFAFDEAWPELAALVVADNQGVFGLATKLGVGKPAAAWLGRLFFVGVLGLAALAARRFAGASRWAQATVWLSLLGLASLASAGAWGDYVTVVAVWVAALLAARATETRTWRLLLGATVVFQGFLIGTFPVGDWAPMALMLPLSGLGVVLMLGLFAAVVASRPEAWEQAAAEDAPVAERAAARAA